jgi:16S rRNA (cytidine1402-2'-O)-methyltransferase
MPLYLVATPIGNLEDITLRALRVLRESSLIACEDTRHTRLLLNHFGIATPTISYHEHNERARATELVERMLGGASVALVSDAGTPGISDPAYRLVQAALEAGIRVIPIPGPTAMVAALVAAGLPTDSFLFVGFLPPRKMARRARLEELREVRPTLVLYEAPHRIRETLDDALEILGDRPAVLARELTKLHEQFRRGTLAGLRQMARSRAATRRDGSRRSAVTMAALMDDIPAIPLADEVDRLTADGSVGRNEAIKQVARRRGLARREAYRIYLEERMIADDTNEEPPPESTGPETALESPRPGTVRSGEVTRCSSALAACRNAGDARAQLLKQGDLGVGVTIAIYQFDDQAVETVSAASPASRRRPSTPEEEIELLRRNLGAEEVELRIRQIGRTYARGDLHRHPADE